jgi:hypothetical protein
MIIFAVLTDKSGITLDHSQMVVVHRVEHQLPLCSVAFRVRQLGLPPAGYRGHVLLGSSSFKSTLPPVLARPQPPQHLGKGS